LVLWLDAEGMKTAYTLSELAPSDSLIVVVADTLDAYGSGHHDVWAGSVGLVVVSVPQKEDGGEWLVGDETNELFAHEFAHGMGLLDEYNYGEPPDEDFPELRNVWKPESTAEDDPMATSTKALPWEDALKRDSAVPVCTLAGMKPCYGYLDAARNVQPCSEMDPNCAYVTRACQERSMFCVDFPCPGPIPGGCPQDIDPKLDLEIHPKCDDFAGAWEGAYYYTTKYYRSRRHCWMKEPGENIEFCDACRIYLNKYLCAYGDPLTCPAWEPTTGGC
jgi:hypothetical protein